MRHTLAGGPCLGVCSSSHFRRHFLLLGRFEDSNNDLASTIIYTSWIMKIVHFPVLGFLLLLTFFGTLQAMTTTGSLKRILVTGGNKGIGKAICERLLQEWKDTHVFLGSRDAQRGQEAVADIIDKLGSDCKGRLTMIQIDTSDDQSVQNAADQFEGEDKLYGIINNAGVSTMTKF